MTQQFILCTFANQTKNMEKKSVRLEFDQSVLDKLQKKADRNQRPRKSQMEYILVKYANSKEEQ